MTKNYCIILAGGTGTRLNPDKPKQFLSINNKPMIIWSLETFNAIPGINNIIVVSPEKHIDTIQRIGHEFNIDKLEKVISGGETRQGSALNALQCRTYSDDDILMFHDAARPFVSADIIRRCLDETREYGASAVYVPTVDTITMGDEGMVKSIPPRDNLYNTQTPQSFTYKIIKKSHDMAIAQNIEATDDVALAIEAGFTVKMITGDYRNVKVTTEFDYEFACWYAENYL